jgi:hypothetical protein
MHTSTAGPRALFPELVFQARQYGICSKMETGRILLVLLAVGLIIFGTYFAWWAWSSLQASGVPDLNRSLWEYASPFVVAAALVVSGVAVLVSGVGGPRTD